MPAHRRAGDADERAADPRRRDDARAARRRSAPTSSGSAPNEVRVHAPDVATYEVDQELAEPDPRLVPARRPAARAPRPRERAAAGRRRDRPPPPRPAHPRVRASSARDRVSTTATSCAPASSRGAHIHLDEASVMATENAVMAAALAPGGTVISNAACEPHVQDLCRFLVSLGAEIEGIGSNVLHINGVERLRGGEHAIGPEHIEVGSFIGMAAVTGGDITIDGIVARRPLADPAGVRSGSAIEIELGDDSVRVPPGPGARDPSTTSAARSRRSRTGPGRRSRPTSPRSRSWSRRRRGARADLREDVREPPVLRRQARLDGRADHPLRPAPRRRHRPGAAVRPADVEPRHPRRAWRC